MRNFLKFHVKLLGLWEFSIEASITISSVSITIPILSTHPYRNLFNLLTNSCSFSFSSSNTGWMAFSDAFLECHGHCKLFGLEPLFLNFNVLEAHKGNLLKCRLQAPGLRPIGSSGAEARRLQFGPAPSDSGVGVAWNLGSNVNDGRGKHGFCHIAGCNKFLLENWVY